MMLTSAKKVTNSICYLFAGLVLFAGGMSVQAQVENEPAPATGANQPPQLADRMSPSYQPGAQYQITGPAGPKATSDKAAADKVERVKQQEKNLRRMMASFGVTELDIQNAIVVYVQEEVQRRQPLREQGRRLYKALRDETISATEMTRLLTDFRAVVEADQTRREAAEAALNNQTSYTTNPRLEAMLLLFGVIGDSPTVMTIPVPSGRQPQGEYNTPDNSKVPGDNTPVPDEALPNTDNNAVRAVQGKPVGSGTTTASAAVAARYGMGFTEEQRLALLDKFDFNRDGELDAPERNEAREYLAREYLELGLWPSPRKPGTTNSNNVSSGNSDANNTGNPPIHRIPGPLPVIPAAQTIEPITPPPGN